MKWTWLLVWFALWIFVASRSMCWTYIYMAGSLGLTSLSTSKGSVFASMSAWTFILWGHVWYLNARVWFPFIECSEMRSMFWNISEVTHDSHFFHSQTYEVRIAWGNHEKMMWRSCCLELRRINKHHVLMFVGIKWNVTCTLKGATRTFDAKR